MIELRWLLPRAYPHTSTGVLQYRTKRIRMNGTVSEDWWDDWQDVPRVDAAPFPIQPQEKAL